VWFLIIGLLLLALHLAGIGPPANWNFQVFGDLWKFALPFVLAVAWWSFSDKMGLTQRRAMRRMDERRVERREKALAALGINTRRERHVQAMREAARRVAADRGDRAELPSRFDLQGQPPGEERRKEPHL
jgi:small Trp-rich protein